MASSVLVHCSTLIACSLLHAADAAGKADAQPEPVSAAAVSRAPAASIDRWRAARFGMFLHWGLYAIPAKGEWYVFSRQVDYEEYKKLAGQFTAERFSAKAWADAAKDAGMRYMVLTARHHDGFALWDSPASFEGFTAMNSAARKDFVADYTAACRSAGLLVGLYYSPLDWRFPGFFFPEMYRKSAEQMRDQTYGQVRELLTKYGKIDILWYDGGGDGWLGLGGLQWSFQKSWHQRDKQEPYRGRPLWEPAKLQAMVRELQPGILTNGRSGAPGEFGSREHQIGDFSAEPWEKCDTINGVWGYKETPARPLPALLKSLSEVVCRDGNYLLNVGPRADGSFDPGHLARLKEIGAWMKINGDAVYGTRGGPLRPTEHYGSTHTADTIYLHIWSWPADGKLIIDLSGIPASRVTTLSGDAVTTTLGDDRLVVERSAAQAEAPLTILVLAKER